MKIFLTACLCFMFVARGYAIQCYTCINCRDTKNLVASQLVNCSSSFMTCQKTSINDVVTRTCGVSTTTGCNKVTLGTITTETCSCKGDKCNGAGTVKSSIIIGSVISLLVAKFLL
uniref:uncharacterized protein LOC120325473 n=1 Tax=Styela clava TaxID=7725 RepID=UPI0019399442|nr:uncharacterized protein LOC120325473 [Styela clava]